MALSQEVVRLVAPQDIERNPENPRLIFREDELLALQDSIAEQGILVPLTVYQSKDRYVILDGERRWRCALKLGLSTVPAIIQPEPDSLTNIMMMFAIHKTRSDWDPLPTALKLQKLEEELRTRLRRQPSEQELSAAASLTRGEVRRYRNILALPERFKDRLLDELERPRPQQGLTVDHVLESVRGAEALLKQGIITSSESESLSDALVSKFESKILTSTVEPRLLPRIARAVARDEVPKSVAQKVVRNLISRDKYTVKDAFKDSIEQVDFEHATEQLVDRIVARLEQHSDRGYDLGPALEQSLRTLSKAVARVLRSAKG